MAGMAQGRDLRRGSWWSAPVWGVAALLLAAPWIAMRFTSDVVWTARDFITFGAMLLLACGAFELAVRLSGNLYYRAAAAAAIGTAFFLVWVTIAVGVIGSETDPANLMFGSVLLVGIIGAAVARLRPQGMMLALVATALAQGMAGAVALAMGWSADVAQTVMLTGMFGAMWLTSATLFWKAAQDSAA